MISVIIPVYNQAKKLAKTLDSLNKQTNKNFEIIIVNDGSSDNPESVFTDFVKKNTINGSLLFFNQKNQGAPAARNRGFRESKGNFLFFCDADAILKPETLEVMQDALIFHPGASFVYSSFKWGSKYFRVGPYDKNRLKKEPYIHTMSLIKRSDFPNSAWDEDIKKFQDWDLWLTMLKAGKYGVWIDQILFTIIPGGTISTWLPSFFYKYFKFLPVVKKYHQAKKIILQKHELV
jgi:glycosyltransferase involved in cell wall biosynthesis